jgi:uncharacterized protein YkwD
MVFMALSASTFIFATVIGKDRSERLGLGDGSGGSADLASVVSTESPAPGGTAAATPPAATTAPGTQPAATTAAAPPPAATDKITTREDQVTALINKERAAAGCKVAVTDERLRKAARAHSADMAKNNYFSHTGKNGSTFVERAVAAGYPQNAIAAENIAYGYPTPEAVVAGWMNSDGHRANILNCSHKTTGVGLAYRGNTPYWTQEFGR